MSAAPTYSRPRSLRLVRAEGPPQKLYRLRVARHGHGIRIDATPTRQHVQHLLDLGLTRESIARAAGVGPTVVGRLTTSPPPRLIDTRIAHALTTVTWRPTERQAVVLSVGARRRAQALAAIGWPMSDLAARVGMTAGNLSVTIAHPRLSYRHWVAIRDVYDEWSMTPGPSRKTRQVAAARGWAPPLAWDDDTIDDPHTDADQGDRRPGRPGVHVDDVEWLIRTGGTWDTVAARCGVGRSAIEMVCRRSGRVDLIAQLAEATP